MFNLNLQLRMRPRWWQKERLPSSFILLNLYDAVKQIFLGIWRLTSISRYRQWLLWAGISIVFYTYLNPVSMLMIRMFVVDFIAYCTCIKRCIMTFFCFITSFFSVFLCDKSDPLDTRELKWHFCDAFIYGVFQGAENNEMFHTVHGPLLFFRLTSKNKSK